MAQLDGFAANAVSANAISVKASIVAMITVIVEVIDIDFFIFIMAVYVFTLLGKSRPTDNLRPYPLLLPVLI